MNLAAAALVASSVAVWMEPVTGMEFVLVPAGRFSWYFGADSARCALRYTHRPQDRGFSLGLRVVREPEDGGQGGPR